MVQGPMFISTIVWWSDQDPLYEFFQEWEAEILGPMVAQGLAKNKDDARDNLFRTAINSNWVSIKNMGEPDWMENASLETMFEAFGEESYGEIQIIETTLEACPGIWGEVVLTDQRSGAYQITTYTINDTEEALGFGTWPIMNWRVS
jgi:hypothetical protein